MTRAAPRRLASASGSALRQRNHTAHSFLARLALCPHSVELLTLFVSMAMRMRV
jgi:hypothetical protein